MVAYPSITWQDVSSASFATTHVCDTYATPYVFFPAGDVLTNPHFCVRTRLLVALQRSGATLTGYSPPITTTALGELLRVSRFSISHAIRDVVADGYVVRIPCSSRHGGLTYQYRLTFTPGRAAGSEGVA